MADTSSPLPSVAPITGTPATEPSMIEAGSTAMDVEAAVDDATKGDTSGPAATNGHTDVPETSDPVAESASKEGDVEMKEPDDSADASIQDSGAATNGTSAANKAATNGSAKKRSSIIPEHRSKKLSRKKSKPTLHLDVKPGELYLARLKGHQPWPSIICDEDMLPNSLLVSRPITTAQPDGTFKKPEYADGGKRAYERTYPVMFLGTNEFAWIVNTELTPLDPEDCTDIAEKGKTKQLMNAYSVAAEGHNLAYFKELLRAHQAAMQEDADLKAERAAKKASKGKRKSVDVAVVEDEDADDVDVDEEEGDSKPKSKKRKKSLDSDGITEKPVKTPKTATRIKLSTPKTPAVETSSKKKSAAKPKGSAKKAAAKADASDEEIADSPKVEEKPLTPAEAQEKKEKEIRYYRHKLQKGFLSRDTVPSDEEIKSMSTYLTKLETYPDLEGSIIRATKIHKVLKAMIKLTSIPKDEEYQFQKRSHDLLAKWNKILADDPSASADKDGDKDGEVKAKATTVVTNGTTAVSGEDDKETAPEAEKEEEDSLEDKVGAKEAAPSVEASALTEEVKSAEKASAEATEAPAESAEALTATA